MKYGLQIVTPPASKPLTLDEIKHHLRILADDADNDLLDSYQGAAVDYIQQLTGRQLLQSVWLMTLDGFPGIKVDEHRPPGWRYGIIRVPKPPLRAVNSVQYVDTDGNLQTLAVTEYQVSTASEPGRIAPARFKVWPVADPHSFDAVRVAFTAGWANADLVPEGIKQAVRLLVGHLNEHREATIEQALSIVPFGLQAFIRSQGYGEYV